MYLRAVVGCVTVPVVAVHVLACDNGVNNDHNDDKPGCFFGSPRLTTCCALLKKKYISNLINS